MEDNTLYLIYAGSDNDKDALQMSLLSLVMKNSKRPIHIFFLTADFTKFDEEYIPLTGTHAYEILTYCKKFNRKLSYELFELDKYIGELFVGQPKFKGDFSPYCLLYLLLDKVDDLPEKALYLSMYTLTMQNIDELYDLDLTDSTLALVKEKNQYKSQVLLLNLKKALDEDFFIKSRSEIKTKNSYANDNNLLKEMTEEAKFTFLDDKFNENDKTKEDTIIRCYGRVFVLLPYPHEVIVKPWQVKDFKEAYPEDAKDIIVEYQEINSEKAHKQEIYNFFNG